jgi:hypothetical protein
MAKHPNKPSKHKRKNDLTGIWIILELILEVAGSFFW